jgi:hypothetical protein
VAIPFPHFFLPPEYVLSYLYGQMKWGIRTLFFNPAMAFGLGATFTMPSNFGFGWVFPAAIRKG